MGIKDLSLEVRGKTHSSARGSIASTIWFFLKPHKVEFVLIVALSAAVGILQTLNIAVLYPILNYSFDLQPGQGGGLLYYAMGYVSRVMPVKDPLILYSIFFMILAVLSFALGLMRVRATAEMSAKITTENTLRVFRKFAGSDYQFFVDSKQGDLLYKAIRAPGYIAETFNTIIRTLSELILSLAVLVLLFSISLIGTLALIGLSIGYYYVTRYLSRRISYLIGTGRYDAGQRQNVVFNEFINGIKQIKVFQTLPHWILEFDKTVNRIWSLWKRDVMWSQLPTLFLTLLLFLIVPVTVIITRMRYENTFISVVPALGTFAFAVFKLLPILGALGQTQMQIMGSIPNLEAVASVLKDTTYDKIRDGHKEFSHLTSGVKFSNVSFTHKNRESTLNDLSLEIKKDKVTAMVGASGSGKSTIVDLLLRLYDVNGGKILIDGEDVRNFRLNSLLDRTGFVSQETFVFNASVRDNIAFGDDYTMSQIEEAAQRANAHDFILQLPQGYDTLVGDRGVKLSGGERQRIAIARAMIRKPELLILDEATSSLDNVSEKIVQEAIDRVSENCTTLIIAHRLSTIKKANVIYVLDQGRVVESGSHDQLIAQRGKYWELYQTRES